jgi:hypothetical protein
MSLEEELMEEIDWRTKEISIIRKLTKFSNYSPDEIDIIKKYSIVAIYALWEGFVKDSFRIYLREINILDLHHSKLDLKLLVTNIDSEKNLSLDRKREDFNQKCNFIIELYEYMSNNFKIKTDIRVASNINCKVINDILKKYNLDLFPENDSNNLDARLNKLLERRMKIAHGEKIVIVSDNEIEELSLTVIIAMQELSLRILQGYKEYRYLSK